MSSSTSSGNPTSPAAKKLSLWSSDGDIFEVDMNVAMESQMLKSMVEDGCGNFVPLPTLTTVTLTMVLEFCHKQVEFAARAAAEGSGAKAAESQRKEWNAEFVKVEPGTLFDLIRAANYLDIKSLLDATCGAVEKVMAGKSPEQVKDVLSRIEKDCNAEEEFENDYAEEEFENDYAEEAAEGKN